MPLLDCIRVVYSPSNPYPVQVYLYIEVQLQYILLIYLRIHCLRVQFDEITDGVSMASSWAMQTFLTPK